MPNSSEIIARQFLPQTISGAKGAYIHQRMQDQFDGVANGYHVSTEGIDIVHIQTGIHFEVLRDTAGSWTAHYRPALQGAPWRALTYI
jgi:hypothetical protein